MELGYIIASFFVSNLLIFNCFKSTNSQSKYLTGLLIRHLELGRMTTLLITSNLLILNQPSLKSVKANSSILDLKSLGSSPCPSKIGFSSSCLASLCYKHPPHSDNMWSQGQTMFDSFILND